MRKTLYFLFALLAIIPVASAETSFLMPSDSLTSSAVCLNDSILESNVTFIVDGNTTLMSSQNICPHGCSSTLNACRQSEAMQLGYALAIFAGFSMLILLFSYMGWLGMGLSILIIPVSILIGTYDAFSVEWIKTIFYIFPLIIIGVLVSALTRRD